MVDDVAIQILSARKMDILYTSPGVSKDGDAAHGMDGKPVITQLTLLTDRRRHKVILDCTEKVFASAAKYLSPSIFCMIRAVFAVSVLQGKSSILPSPCKW